MEAESGTSHTAIPIRPSERYYCQFGPLEWIWRMFTYGKVFKLTKERNG